MFRRDPSVKLPNPQDCQPVSREVDELGSPQCLLSFAAMAPQAVDKVYLPDLESCLKGETVIL